MRSAGVRAESNAERALAMSPKTVCSCAAKPFTVSTRLGIKSARRCSTTSTCAHAAFTASFLMAIWFLRPMNELPKSSAITTRTAKTIRTFFISTSNLSISTACFLHALPFPLRKMMVERVQHFFQRFEIRSVRGNNFPVEFAAFAEFQERVESTLVSTGQRRGLRDDFVRVHRWLLSKSNHRMPKQGQYARKGFSQYRGQFVSVSRCA